MIELGRLDFKNFNQKLKAQSVFIKYSKYRLDILYVTTVRVHFSCCFGRKLPSTSIPLRRTQQSSHLSPFQVSLRSRHCSHIHYGCLSFPLSIRFWGNDQIGGEKFRIFQKHWILHLTIPVQSVISFFMKWRQERFLLFVWHSCSLCLWEMSWRRLIT